MESKVLHKCTCPQNKKTTDIENSLRLSWGQGWERDGVGAWDYRMGEQQGPTK